MPGERPRPDLTVFEPEMRDDLLHWIRTDRKMAIRVMQLVEATCRDPYDGIGKPEPLRHIPDAWSRRITDEHRMTYKVYADRINFLGCRLHYSDY